MDVGADLEALYASVRRCRLCALSQSRNNAVPGEGPEAPAIMFIGEAPGFHEDQQSRPFVGQAGKFLEELLATIGMRREQVYIANVIKCRPPSNRDPLPAEMQACAPYLDRQLEILKPALVVTLGRHSMARYFPNETISRVHGHVRQVGGLTVFPMYHPAAALHQPAYKKLILADMQKIPALLASRQAMADRDRPPDAQQLAMF